MSGSWWLRSKSDPRFNKDGISSWVGGFEIPKEAQDAIDELKREYGILPDDLECGYMKD